MSTATKAHTPGPWFQHHSPDSVRVCNGKHDSEEGCIMIAEAEIIGYERAESEANARLVAAAPEMLEALELLVKQGAFPTEAYEKALAVIRKVRGGE